MIPLTEAILQKCYKTKTYIRNDEWDILWYLGGKNNITIGEKNEKYYLLSPKNPTPVTDVLPFELIQGSNFINFIVPHPINTLKELAQFFPEIDYYMSKEK